MGLWSRTGACGRDGGRKSDFFRDGLGRRAHAERGGKSLNRDALYAYTWVENVRAEMRGWS
jgi:hypothetical protein